MNKIRFLIILLSCTSLVAQESVPSISQNLDEITVTGYSQKSVAKSTIFIESIKADSLSSANEFSLSDKLAKRPGISLLSTGLAISKPVIRGLYGNRILILLSGLKFDNQQWQEEHGLGLANVGIDRVELIRGPIGILYGTEAIGGVVNVIEETMPKNKNYESEYGLQFHSNTLGLQADYGYKQKKLNHWWSLRLAASNHADYSDGNNTRIVNSRFDAYTLKSNYGFTRKNWNSTNHYMTSFNRFGFIFKDIYTFVEADNRWSRNLSVNPAHYVLLNILSSENNLALRNNSSLQINLGVQSNSRMENEGSGAISLNMHLLSYQNQNRFSHRINEKHQIILSNLNSIESNKNYGARKIVPDAFMQESNISIYEEYGISKKIIWENGIGLGEKYIHTFFTPTVNGQGKEVQPFKKFSPYYNFFTGVNIIPNPFINLKWNFATGVRIGNLAELSSNGLHEGIFTYEIGNPELKNEQIFSTNLYLNFQKSKFSFSLSPFYNYFLNYIYLSPTNETWFGFPVYRYLQKDVYQYGTEITSSYQLLPKLKIELQFSTMKSIGKDGISTPYVPAQKWKPQIEYLFLKNYQFHIETEFISAQNDTATFEQRTSGYKLVNLGISKQLFWKGNKVQCGISAFNIFNQAYTDHLSRFKNYGLLNVGRNISLQFKINL